MNDWRVSDGYFHYERDKSQYPAYPFRLSARDAARFGLLFAREGLWGDEQILSRNWVRRSTALYSIDSDVFGYGFMWWIAREPRFAKHGFAAALGVGNQMIAALPDSDIVIVNRANTYDGEGTPMEPLLDLIEAVLEARTGEAVAEPNLVALEPGEPDAYATQVPNEQLAELVGEWAYPPAALGLPAVTTVEITLGDGSVNTFSEVSGTFENYLQPDGWLVEEDSQERYLPIRDADGNISGISGIGPIVRSALVAAAEGETKTARKRLALVEGESGTYVETAEVILDLVRGARSAERSARALIERSDPAEIERRINGFGYGFLTSDRGELAEDVFALNTRLFPDSANTWDSLGESQMEQGKSEESIRSYQHSIDLDPENTNAQDMIDQMRAEAE
jgi:tetratricopeptide (TPR) repeat protein